MKKILILSALVLTAVCGWAESKLIINPIVITPGATVTVPVEMENDEEVNMIQLFFTLSDGLTAKKPTLVSSRIGTHYDEDEEDDVPNNITVSYNNKDGEYRSLVLDKDEARPFAGNSGAVLNIRITASADIQPGTYYMNVTCQILGTVDEQSFEAEPYSVPITVPASATMAIGAGNRYGTFCAPFDVAVPAGVTAYTGVVNGNVVELTAVGATVAAGTPVIIESDEAVDKTFTGTVTAEGETCACGSLVGTYSSQTIPQGSYALQKHGDVVAFYLVTSNGVTTRANGCYLTAGSSNARMFTFGDVTAIDGISALVGAGSAVYDAAGARQSRLQKGVNIVVGADGAAHKVIVK